MRRRQHAYRWIPAFGFLLLLMAATPAREVVFTDITQTSKIDFKQENSATSNKYLVETMGGGVALLDYDNDGRLDIFFTNGAKIDDPMPRRQAARQVRPQILEPALSSESRRHIHRRDGKGRPHRHAAEPLRHGCRGRRLRQRRIRRPVRHRLRRKYAVPQQRQWHLHRCHQHARASPPADGARAPGFSTTTTTASSTSSSPATWIGAFENNRYCGEKQARLPRLLPSRQLRRRRPTSCITTTATAPSRMSPQRLASPTRGQRTRRGVRRLRRRWLHRYLRGQRFGAVFPLPQQSATALSPRSACWPASASTRTARPSPAWAWTSRDYDNDGRPDIVVTDLSNERYMLFRNNGDGTLPGRDQSLRAWARDACRSRAGARACSTTTTTAGRTCSSRRAT